MRTPVFFSNGIQTDAMYKLFRDYREFPDTAMKYAMESLFIDNENPRLIAGIMDNIHPGPVISHFRAKAYSEDHPDIQPEKMLTYGYGSSSGFMNLEGNNAEQVAEYLSELYRVSDVVAVGYCRDAGYRWELAFRNLK
ncbi:MAG: hypothetical protein J7K54_01735 [Candidatus Aenigmarchaeota archaeon]|nr:hypothetical protein [Candidatus Aenigmarchaeota archaeon]